MFLDFRKAFDNVKHDFLLVTLKKMNFKLSFIKWVKTLYSNACGRVHNYGWLSQKFCIERGVRQGCPLSALLFIIVAEVLATKIRQNDLIKGIELINDIKVGHIVKEIKIVQYADDTVIFVDSEESVRCVMEEVNRFGDNAGPKVNWDKSDIMVLKDDIIIENLKCSDAPVKCLGVFVGKNNDEIDRLNWAGRIEKITNIINLWKKRRLTYFGKVTIIKLLIASQFVYISTAVPVPNYILKELNGLIFSFLWNSKIDKVKRSVIINEEIAGGLNMVDMDLKLNSLRLSWISKFLSDKNGAWKILFSYWTSKIGGFPLLLKYNCNTKDIVLLANKFKLPAFYLDFVCIWSKLRFIDLLHVTEIENQVLWYNSNIKCMNDMLYFQTWINLGIIKVKDVIRNGQWCELKDIFPDNIANNLLYNFNFVKLKKSFPKCWLDKLQDRAPQNNNNESLFEISAGNSIDINTMKARHFYSVLIKMKRTKPLFCIYWQAYFALPEDFIWNDVLLFKLKQISVNTIKQFNFRLLHRILPSKDNLFKWKILNENKCDVCNCVNTTLHMLLRCKAIKILWKIIENIIFHMYKIIVRIDEKVIIIGVQNFANENWCINFIINITEFVIYRNYIEFVNDKANNYFKTNIIIERG